MISRCIVVFALAVFGASADRVVPHSYPVHLNHYGPSATRVPILNSHVRTRIMERVPLRTAGCVPQPKTVSNTCTCVKTVLKPQVHNQIISVPAVQRIIQTVATPVVEKIHYPATPMESQVPAFPVNFFSGGLVGSFPAIAGPGCGSFISFPSCGCAKTVFV